jgi:hypothetical protein
METESVNPFIGGKARPVTDEQIERAKALGINPESLSRLLRAGTDYEFDDSGKRIEPERYRGDPNVIYERENHHMILPDPQGVYYLKVTISGKTIVKPLDKDPVKARKMRDKHLKDLKYTPSRHSAR